MFIYNGITGITVEEQLDVDDNKLVVIHDDINGISCIDAKEFDDIVQCYLDYKNNGLNTQQGPL